MSGPPEHDLEAGLRALWERRRPSVLGRVALIEDAVAALRMGELDAERRRLAAGEAHKLAGAAGSFGFPEASERARVIEQRLEGERALTADDAARLAAEAAGLRRALAEPGD